MNTSPDAVLIERRRATVTQLTLAGCSATEISARIGATTRSVQRHRKAAGISRPPSQPMSQDEIDTARAMLVDGASYSEVSRTLRRAIDTLQRHLPGYGWNQAMAAEYRHARERLDALRPVIEVPA